MNTEHLRLFTPVSEGLPIDEDFKLCIYTDGFVETISLFRYKDNEWLIATGEFYDMPSECPILHWLDLSKLTTIERAVEFAELSFVAGHKYCQEGREGQNFYKFIQQNKNKI